MANIPEYVLRTRREAALWECLKRNREMSEQTSASHENKSDQNASEGLATASQQYANYYKQTADSIQKITRINAIMMVLTVGLVVGTWAQAYWTRETLRDSDRAWIGVTTVKPIFVAGTILIPQFTPGVQIIYRVDVESVNGGRGPAINVKTTLRLRVGKPIPTPTSGVVDASGPMLPECVDDKTPLPQGDGVLMIPNTPRGTEVNPEPDVGNLETEKNIVNNAVGLYLTGCIDYDDEFGVWHRTHVCRYWSGHDPTAFFACITGNLALKRK